jgi:ribosomal protein S18 acetylase RimI-like enzyme
MRPLWLDMVFISSCQPSVRSGIDARAGAGRRLMMEAEAEALRRGCCAAELDTFSFQARGFYERLGYSVFGALEDYAPGQSRFYMRKRLDGGAPP